MHGGAVGLPSHLHGGRAYGRPAIAHSDTLTGPPTLQEPYVLHLIAQVQHWGSPDEAHVVAGPGTTVRLGLLVPRAAK